MHSRLLVIFLISVLVVAPLSSPVLAQSESSAPDESANTVIHIYVYENGTAEWVVQTRTRLETENETAAFREFQDDYQTDSAAHLDGFQDRMSGVVADANATTDRDMTIREFGTRAFIQELPRRWGVVESRFLWDGFALRAGESLTVGDVFDGGWILSGTDTLVLHTPANYIANTSSPMPDSADEDRLIWNGPVTFADERPEVSLVANDPPEPDVDDTGLSLGIILGGMILLIVVILGTTLYWHRRGPDAQTPPATPESRTPPMTDSEQVLDLLRKNDGRMKQADIDAEFEWSKSKTSLLISDLADEDKVAKVRLGRENLITLVESDN